MIWCTILLACGTPTPDAPAEADTLGLALDGAERWQMDDHTRAVMGRTRATLDAAKVDGAEAGRGLAGTLQALLDELIEGCTMEGPSHDELHVFLMKWIPVVSELQTVQDDAQAKVLVEKLRSMLREYERFFAWQGSGNLGPSQVRAGIPVPRFFMLPVGPFGPPSIAASGTAPRRVGGAFPNAASARGSGLAW